jgi:hypothetical protein
LDVGVAAKKVCDMYWCEIDFHVDHHHICRELGRRSALAAARRRKAQPRPVRHKQLPLFPRKRRMRYSETLVGKR